MGVVYLGWQRAMDRYVAIKTLKPATGPHREMLEKRFTREAKATAALKSPHTVTVYDFGALDDGTLFLVMEHLVGTPLNDLVERDGALPLARVRDIGQQVCLSLAEAHGAGIVHRDMKPSNIFIERAARVRAITSRCSTLGSPRSLAKTPPI